MRVRGAAIVAIVIVPVMAGAQQFLQAPPGTAPVDPTLRFEVVAIKPIEDASSPIRIMMTPGGLESSVPVGVLLRQALQKPDYQMAGAPGWINTERYSIRAKTPAGVPPGALSVLMVNLLKDRFQLATHVETREQGMFNLVMARTDGRLGPDLRPTPPECQTTIAERAEAARRGALPQPGALPGPDDPLPCGFGRIAPGIIAFSGRSIAQLIPSLADLVGRPVIDKTGLTGLHDMTLRYRPEGRNAGPMGPLPQVPGTPTPFVDPDAPSISVALQEQLGLRLESARGPVEIVVIDKLEKPTLD